MSKIGGAADWDDMRFFLAVCRLGTLSAAADQLKVDHTTVSRRLTRLETSLNVSLFIRRNSGYETTLAGEKLLATAEAMEVAMLAAEADVGDRDLSLRGIVRIGAPDGFGSYFLAPRMKGLFEAHPSLEIELVATARVFNLTKREADIAISLTTPQRGRVVGRKLVDYSLYLYASKEYLTDAPAIRSIDDLSRHRFIGYIEDLLFSPELNYRPKVTANHVPRFRSANLIAQFNAVRSGMGLAVLPAFMATPVPELIPVLPNQVKLTRTFFLHLHEDSRRVTRIRETADYIVDQVTKNREIFNPAFERANTEY